MKLHALCMLVALLSPSWAGAQNPPPAAIPRYGRAIEQELSTMGLGARCASEDGDGYRCSFTRPSSTGRGLEIELVYSDRSDTIYVYVSRYLLLRPQGRATQSVLQRLMELNWELLSAKFEWNPRTGEVRLSSVLSTDSNFDRRALRSTLHALEAVASRYETELLELAQ